MKVLFGERDNAVDVVHWGIACEREDAQTIFEDNEDTLPATISSVRGFVGCLPGAGDRYRPTLRFLRVLRHRPQYIVSAFGQVFLPQNKETRSFTDRLRKKNSVQCPSTSFPTFLQREFSSPTRGVRHTANYV